MNNPEEEIENQPITFHCSYQLIPRSLGDISEAFRIKRSGKNGFNQSHKRGTLWRL